jgi:hypothetical protein
MVCRYAKCMSYGVMDASIQISKEGLGGQAMYDRVRLLESNLLSCRGKS